VEQWKEEKGKEITLLKKNNLIQDSEGNEESEYPVPDPNKIKINDTKEPVMPTKTPSKKKSCK
jgi:hypothetical protein